MRERTRPATLTDLWRLTARSQHQRVLRLDPLRTLIHSDSLTGDDLRARLPFQKRDTFVFVCTEGGSVLGWIEARYGQKKRDEWSITTIGASDHAPDHIWAGLFDEVCREAGERGVTKLFAQVPKDEPLGADLRTLGFTHYADERIWGNLLLGTSRGQSQEPERKPLRPQTDTDAWDLMQLYAAVTPPAVRRAEDPTTRQWRKMRAPFFAQRGTAERAYVWADEASSKGGIGGHISLLTGARGHWITLMYRPDPANRSRCPLALDYVLWKAARLGTKPVYCGVREYMQETKILLEERGFQPLSHQELLVKYLARPLEVRQPALVPFLVPKREMAATGER